jgi:hypothetical protein
MTVMFPNYETRVLVTEEAETLCLIWKGRRREKRLPLPALEPGLPIPISVYIRAELLRNTVII